jgi:hypothetical protein
MKLTKAHMRALSYLSSQLTFVSQRSIPNGNGHTSGGGATSQTMAELKREGLVELGKTSIQTHYGYRITPAGRQALSGSKE